MLNFLQKSFGSLVLFQVRRGVFFIAATALLLSFLQSACIFKKGKPKVTTPPSEASIVLLPFNVPAGNQDLRWTAMAFPILMGTVAERAPDLKVLPLWESMPTAIGTGGAMRTFTAETAASVASWLSQKWSVMGDISTTKTGVRVMIDFIPAKTGPVPFRFTKSGKPDEVGAQLPASISQFAYYLTIRPLAPEQKKLPTLTAVKKIAEALDREYGWFVEAEPGKAQAVVTELASTDIKLARLLFNPSVYPTLATK